MKNMYAYMRSLTTHTVTQTMHYNLGCKWATKQGNMSTLARGRLALIAEQDELKN